MEWVLAALVKIETRRWVIGAMTVAGVLIIWRNSLYPAVESAAQSGKILEILLPILERFGLPLGALHDLLRKGAHMIEFTVLGLLSTLFLAQWSGPVWHKGLRGVELSGVVALIDETIQIYIPGRGSLVSDVWVDIAGAVIGAAVAVLIYWLLHRRKQT